MDLTNQDPLPSGYTSDKLSEELNEGLESGIEALDSNGTVLPVNLTCPITSDVQLPGTGIDIIQEYSNNSHLRAMDDMINLASPPVSPISNLVASDEEFPTVNLNQDDLEKWASEIGLPNEVKREPMNFTILDEPSAVIDMESIQDLEQYINPSSEVRTESLDGQSVAPVKKERRPGGRRPLKTAISKHIDDDELCQLSTRELNLRLKNIPADEVAQLKSRRRTIKNRGYAMNCRNRRSVQQQTVVQTVAELQQEVERLREENDRLRNENQEVHAENYEINNILRQRGIVLNRRRPSVSNCSSVSSPGRSITSWDAMLSPGLPSSPE